MVTEIVGLYQLTFLHYQYSKMIHVNAKVNQVRPTIDIHRDDNDIKLIVLVMHLKQKSNVSDVFANTFRWKEEFD